MHRDSQLLRLAVISIGALALRPQLLGIGPLVPLIRTDLAMSFAEAGLLSTIPLLCMGVFAPLAPTLVAAWGASRTVAACLALLAASGAIRAASPTSGFLLVLTVPVGLGIGIAGATLPVLVKEWLPRRPALATGVYTFFIQAGTVVATGTAVPLALAFGSWRLALAALAGAGLLSLAAWLLLAGAANGRPRGPARISLTSIPFRDPVAWLLATIFALTAVPYYGLSAWLPSAYVEHGWSELEAGSLFATIALTGLPGSLIASVLAERGGSRRAYLVVPTLVVIVSVAGLILAPSLAWVFAVVGGGFLGAVFTMSLTLPLDVGTDTTRVASVVSLMMAVGYCLMAFLPSLLGAIRDATGSFTLSLWVIVGACLALLAAGALASPTRLAGGRADPRPTPTPSA